MDRTIPDTARRAECASRRDLPLGRPALKLIEKVERGRDALRGARVNEMTPHWRTMSADYSDDAEPDMVVCP